MQRAQAESHLREGSERLERQKRKMIGLGGGTHGLCLTGASSGQKEYSFTRTQHSGPREKRVGKNRET